MRAPPSFFILSLYFFLFKNSSFASSISFKVLSIVFLYSSIFFSILVFILTFNLHYMLNFSFAILMVLDGLMGRVLKTTVPL